MSHTGAVATILCDLLKAFDQAVEKLIDAAVRTRFPVRHLKVLLQLYQAARHVELDGVTCEELQAQRGITPERALATTLLQLRSQPCPSASGFMTTHFHGLVTSTVLLPSSRT